MRRLRRDDEFADLDRALRASRVEATPHFVQKLSSRIRTDRLRHSTGARLRFGLAAATTAALVAAFAGFGGLGYAASGVKKAAVAVVKVAAPKPAPKPKPAPQPKPAPKPAPKITPPPTPPKPPVTTTAEPATTAAKVNAPATPTTTAKAPASAGNVNSSASSQYGAAKKQDVCHKGHTINISSNAVPAHQAHGDTVGPC